GAEGLRALAAARGSFLRVRARREHDREPHPERLGLCDYLLWSLPRWCALLHEGRRGGGDARALVRPSAPRLLQHPGRASVRRAARQPEPPDRAPSLPRHAEQPLPGGGAARACAVRSLRSSLQYGPAPSAVRLDVREHIATCPAGACGCPGVT